MIMIIVVYNMGLARCYDGRMSISHAETPARTLQTFRRTDPQQYPPILPAELPLQIPAHTAKRIGDNRQTCVDLCRMVRMQVDG